MAHILFTDHLIHTEIAKAGLNQQLQYDWLALCVTQMVSSCLSGRFFTRISVSEHRNYIYMYVYIRAGEQCKDN